MTQVSNHSSQFCAQQTLSQIRALLCNSLVASLCCSRQSAVWQHCESSMPPATGFILGDALGAVIALPKSNSGIAASVGVILAFVFLCEALHFLRADMRLFAFAFTLLSPQCAVEVGVVVRVVEVVVGSVVDVSVVKKSAHSILMFVVFVWIVPQFTLHLELEQIS